MKSNATSKQTHVQLLVFIIAFAFLFAVVKGTVDQHTNNHPNQQQPKLQRHQTIANPQSSSSSPPPPPPPPYNTRSGVIHHGDENDFVDSQREDSVEHDFDEESSEDGDLHHQMSFDDDAAGPVSQPIANSQDLPKSKFTERSALKIEDVVL